MIRKKIYFIILIALFAVVVSGDDAIIETVE